LDEVELMSDDIGGIAVHASGTRWAEGRVAAALQTHPGSIAIDAGGLTYMDSSGLRSLLVVRAAAEEAGVPFRITQPSPALRHVVERTGLKDQLLDE
jgi:anti-anti-sigma factor